jgi:uncharacterized protein YlxW (UPF0749 family)
MSDDDRRQQTQPARIPEPRDRPDAGEDTAGGQLAGTAGTADAGDPDAPTAEAGAEDTTDPHGPDPADDEDGPGDPEPPAQAPDTEDVSDTGSDTVSDGADAGPDAASDGDYTDGRAGTPSRSPQRPAARRRAAGLRASVLIGILFALLGFGLAVQVRTTSSTSGLSSARQEDLVRILDDLSSREDRLRQQIASLESARSKLLTSGDKASVALSEARNRSATLGILAGTVPAQGPGVQVTINDPGHKLDSEDLLDAVEELRAAGAEAFQVNRVRIGVSSAFTDDHGSVLADGVRLDPPYVILAIGDPATLATALNIPGGVVASVRNVGGQAVVEQRQHLVIDALRPVRTPDRASPAPTGGN